MDVVCIGDTSVMCPLNYYCPMGSDKPLTCGSGRVSLEGSRDGLACNCSTGSTGAAGANLPCDVCQPGYYCPSSSINDQTLCPLSSYCPIGSSSPVACGDNRITTATMSDSSDDCICDDGMFDTNNGSSGANQSCGICPSGSYCRGGAAPVICPSSYYCPLGSSEPLSCNDDDADTTDGTRVSNEGSSSSDNCTCIAGMVGINGANITCNICSAGSYCSGGTSIIVCPANSYCPLGSSETITCGNKRISLEGSSDGSACNCTAGSFGSFGASLPCDVCSSGYYCPPSSQSPIDCPVGYYCPAGVATPLSCGLNRTTLDTNSESSNDCQCQHGIDIWQ